MKTSQWMVKGSVTRFTPLRSDNKKLEGGWNHLLFMTIMFVTIFIICAINCSSLFLSFRKIINLFLK